MAMRKAPYTLQGKSVSCKLEVSEEKLGGKKRGRGSEEQEVSWAPCCGQTEAHSESRTFSSIRRVTAFEFTPRRVGKPSHLFTVAAGLRNAAAFEDWIKALHSMVLGSELPLSPGAWEGPRARLASSDGITEEGSR